MGTIADATKENYEELVGTGTVLVDVWGPECRPCLALMPHVEKLAEDRPELNLVKLEAPTARRLCMSLKVMGLPAYILYRDGAELSRLSGNDITPASLEAWIDESSAGAP